MFALNQFDFKIRSEFDSFFYFFIKVTLVHTNLSFFISASLFQIIRSLFVNNFVFFNN
jgi:hypothetical protein